MQTPLLNFLQQQLPSSLDLLRQMVNINSFTANKEGVDRLGQFTATAFAPLGFTAERVPSIRPDFGHHLVLTRPGRSRRTIGLISHLDTVFPPEEEQRHHFAWRVEGDRIYGPGTMDIKGGTMMIHLVLSAIQKFAPETFDEITWMVLLNASEEVYSVDFGQLCLEKLGPECRAALIFEAGACSSNAFPLVTARKGRAAFRIEVVGRGAHAGGHHQRGANAIVQLAETIHHVAALTDYTQDLTYNIGNISGGTVINRVPHEARAEGEMRCFNMEVFRAGVTQLLALQNQSIIRAAEDGHPCSVSIKVVQESPPWGRNEGTEQLLRLFQKNGRQLELSVVREERGGISDGNFICHAVPTLDGLGPCGDNDHCSEQSADGTKQQEHLFISSIVPKAALNTLTILDLAKM